MKDIKKILIIRLGAIGDIVFTTIVPYAVKQKHPDCEIHCLLPKGLSSIMQNNPYVDKIYVWDREQGKSKKYFFSMLKTLYLEHYDVIFNFNNTLRSFMFTVGAMPKKRVFKKSYGGSWVDDFFVSAKNVFKDIEKPDRLFLGKNETIDREIEEYLSQYKRPYIMIAPGGESSRNRAGRTWNINYWKELTQVLLKKYGGTIFVSGSAPEKEEHSILEGENVVVLTGQHSLEQTNSLFSYADLVISGDTGPIHIASAHNVKTLALLGSTSPDKIKPYGKEGYWISSDYHCKYCWKKKCKYNKSGEKYTPCMETLLPSQVLDEIAAKALL